MIPNDLTYSAFESRYRDRQYIGSGGFAKVYKVFDHARNHYVALKMADVKPELKKFTLKNEVELVNKLPQHRNIARYDACYRFNTGSLTGEMDFAILRFYEYGNLEQFLKKQQITLADKRFIIQGILEGIAFLHNNNVIHRDLKAQNVLLHREDGVWTPKITDFGLSREVLESGDITNSAIGISYSYAAPEQIRNKKIYKNVDLWAAGVIIYRVLAGELPFKGRSEGDDRSTQSQLELSRKIINLELPAALNNVLEPYQTMIRRCLVLNPEERVHTAEELIQILNNQGDLGPSTQDPPFEGIPNVDNQLNDETELIQNPQRESVPSSIPPAYTPPPSPKTPPGFPPAPGENYNIPRANVTQVIKKKEAYTKKVPIAPPGNHYQPQTGEPKRRFSWLWIVFILLLAGGGIGGYYWYINPDAFQRFTKSGKTEDSNAIVLAKDRYRELDQSIDENRTSVAALLSLGEDIDEKINSPENANNYRPHYLKAKVLAITAKNPRLTFQELLEAAKLAITYKDASRMLLDLQKDELDAFKHIRKYKKNWDTLINSLEAAI